MTWEEFEWDAAKSDACFERRGFDFPFAARVFLDKARQIREDHRWDYGEHRFQIVGRIDGRLYVLVYTLRGNVVRIISARKANSREMRIYENNAHQS
jgi:uncharacterized DUF497 family protein